MQVDVHRIDAEVAGAHLADDRVEVGAVAIDKGAGRVDGVADQLHFGFEKTAGVRIGDHHRRDVRPQPCLQRLEVDTAGGGRRDVLDPVAGEGRGRRVRPVRAFRDQYHLALVSPRFERRADAEQTAELTVGAGFGAHRDTVHAGEVEQPEGKLVDHLERTLNGLLRLERMDVRKAWKTRDLFVQARIVLHGARAEREQAQVDGVILPGQAGVVANGFGLTETRKSDGARTFEAAEPRSAPWYLGEVDAGGLPAIHLKDQRLLKHQRAIAGDGLGLALLIRRSGRAPARRIDGHWTTSLRAASSAPMSSSVTVSVTAMTSPFSSASAPG